MKDIERIMADEENAQIVKKLISRASRDKEFRAGESALEPPEIEDLYKIRQDPDYPLNGKGGYSEPVRAARIISISKQKHFPQGAEARTELEISQSESETALAEDPHRPG